MALRTDKSLDTMLVTQNLEVIDRSWKSFVNDVEPSSSSRSLGLFASQNKETPRNPFSQLLQRRADIKPYPCHCFRRVSKEMQFLSIAE